MTESTDKIGDQGAGIRDRGWRGRGREMNRQDAKSAKGRCFWILGWDRRLVGLRLSSLCSLRSLWFKSFLPQISRMDTDDKLKNPNPLPSVFSVSSVVQFFSLIQVFNHRFDGEHG